MVLDTSAVFAVLLHEPERDAFSRLMLRSAPLLISAATVLECGVVAIRRAGLPGEAQLLEIMQSLQLEIVPFDGTQLAVARQAFRTFGRGRHVANLNFGDCFSYSLAKLRNQPLLFKGDDFSKTDVTPAL